jgi:hypothetical protein
VVDFVNVLTVQSALLATQEQWVESSTGVSLAMVGLYKALGGGWQSVYPEGQMAAMTPGVVKAQTDIDGSAVADLK